MIHNHWLRITHHDSQPLAQHNTPSFTTTCSDKHNMIHLNWGSGYESWCVILRQWLWIKVCTAEPVVVNHGVLCWARGCESWCVMMSQWLWIMVCYAEPVVVYHGVLCWASGCESWGVILSRVVVNHCVVCSATHHDSQQLAQNNTPWFTTTGSA
jgi:hypothetical protein